MNILDGLEKTYPENFPLDKEKAPDKLILLISYKGDGYESFELDPTVAKATVKGIMKLMSDGAELPITFFLHNKPSTEGGFEIGENVDDFRGIIRIDEDMRAIRLIDPKQLK